MTLAEAADVIREAARTDDACPRPNDWRRHVDDQRAMRDLQIEAERAGDQPILDAIAALGLERAAAVYGCERCALRSGQRVG